MELIWFSLGIIVGIGATVGTFAAIAYHIAQDADRHQSSIRHHR